MKIIVIATIAQNGVIGRTKKTCATCSGAGFTGLGHLNVHHPRDCPGCCQTCLGMKEVPANDLPWGRSYPEDLAHFRAATIGGIVVMGHRTWRSIRCRRLHGRHNIVVLSARQIEESTAKGAIIESPHPTTLYPASSLDDALDTVRELALGKTVHVIGGARLFAEALPLADELDLTLIGREWEGDVRFPCFDVCDPFRREYLVYSHEDGRELFAFDCVSREPCPTNSDLTFTKWVRRG